MSMHVTRGQDKTFYKLDAWVDISSVQALLDQYDCIGGTGPLTIYTRGLRDSSDSVPDLVASISEDEADTIIMVKDNLENLDKVVAAIAKIGGRPRILVVDDEPGSRASAEYTLNHAADIDHSDAVKFVSRAAATPAASDAYTGAGAYFLNVIMLT